MALRTLHILTAVGLAVIVISGAYVLGKKSAVNACQEYEFQIASAKKALEWSVEVKTLSLLREGKTKEAIPELEKWIADRLADLDLAKLPDDSIGRYVLTETVGTINAYRARFPDTLIDPSKEPRLSGVLALQKK